MFTKQEMSNTRQKFWTSLGQYLAPIPGAGGEKVNWINYKTGIRYIGFKMDVTNHYAYIAIELSHKEPELQQSYFDKLQSLKPQFDSILHEDWIWESNAVIDGKNISRIYKTQTAVNIFSENDWPGIISFLKPRLLLLDKFWFENSDFIELHR